MLISSKNSDSMTMLINSKVQHNKHYIQSYICQTIIISIEKYAFWHVLQKACLTKSTFAIYYAM